MWPTIYVVKLEWLVIIQIQRELQHCILLLFFFSFFLKTYNPKWLNFWINCTLFFQKKKEIFHLDHFQGPFQLNLETYQIYELCIIFLFFFFFFFQKKNRNFIYYIDISILIACQVQFQLILGNYKVYKWCKNEKSNWFWMWFFLKK